MLRGILVALDGSPFSVAAVELGMRWALRSGARLVGLGIVDEPAILRPEPVPLGASHHKHERDQARLADARRKVDLDFLRLHNVDARPQAPPPR